MKKTLLFLFLFSFPVFITSQSVFINEIHYENEGADTNEGIEIAGPSGTDLSAYKLIGYNGNGGKVYSQQTLSGTLPDQGNGYGTSWFSFTGLQNGSPDGIALVKVSDNSVIQFLSYEGNITATDGAATGISSTDIGVSEPINTTTGYSMQLSGTGNKYTDFAWQAPATSTMGTVNTGQTFTPPDETPPVWKASYPFIDNLLAYSGDLNVNLDKTGKVYFIVCLDGAEVPTSEQVKAGVDYSSTTVQKAENFMYTKANTDQVYVINGATAATAWDIWVVAEDDAGNLQLSPSLCEATTTSTGIKILFPEGGETFAVGQEITFTWESLNVTNLLIGGYDFTNEEHFLITEDGDGNPDPIAASLGSYAFTIPNDAALDSLAIIMVDAGVPVVRDSIAPIYISDNVPPGIDELNPINGATEVNAGMSFLIFFEEPVFKGVGNIYIKEFDGDAVFEQFDIAGSGPEEELEFIDDNYGLKISPTESFVASTKYYIEMDAGVVVDFYDNDFAGISGSSTWNFTIEGTLAVNDDFADKIKLYPVPVSTELTITGYNNLKSIEILDLTGSRVFSTSQIGDAEFKLDASLFPRGFYFLKLETDKGLVTRKFIKK